MRIAIAVALATLCAGCGFLPFDQKPLTTKPPAICTAVAGAVGTPALFDQACVEAADILNKANITLAAIDQTIDDNFDAGIWTKDEARSYRDKAKAAGAQLDRAYEVFKAKNFSAALSQANLTQTLILALQKEIAAEARKK